jgi:hypothetical protein
LGTVPIDRTEDGFFEKQYPSQHPKRLLDTKILVPLTLKFYVLESFRLGFVHLHPFFLLTRILEIVLFARSSLSAQARDRCIEE